MALSMVHLLSAEQWARSYPHLHDCPEFYLGAISPDAMHVRFGSDKSRKNEFHLNNWLSQDLPSIHAYWQEHFTPFDIGYGLHVLTDGTWIPFVKEAFPEMVNPHGRLDPSMYYNDVYQTDFSLYREHPVRPFLWSMLEKAAAPDSHPLLTAEELQKWKEAQFALYDAPCPTDGPVERIDMEFIGRFLTHIAEIMHRETRRYFDK